MAIDASLHYRTLGMCSGLLGADELGDQFAHDADTPRREERILQAQRMMQVGCMSGRIAHDINNLLTVIEGSAGLAADSLSPYHSAQHDLEVIRQASQRSAAMVRQLLAFVRQQPQQPFHIHVGELIAGLDLLIEHIAGRGVSLVFDIAPDLWLTMATRSQIEQILFNLVTNARDAMPDGGQMTILARNYVEESAGGLAEYVLLEVFDTGVGIAPEAQRRLFEPFYTTKDPTKGVGLGLTICASIAAQLGGRIELDSVVGEGTAVRVLLPKA